MRYVAYGTTISSELELPGLTRGTRDGSDLVRVVRGSVPSPSSSGSWTALGPDRAVLVIEGVARFEVVGGERIVVDPVSSDLRHVAHFALGSAMALLLGQRGLFPLHASAVQVDGVAIAIAGQSGAGKSTLAHGLSRRGGDLLADDITALEFGGEATRVHPARCALRLNPDVVRAAGVAAEDARPLHGASDKSLVEPAAPGSGSLDSGPSGPGAADATALESVPLARVYALRPGERVHVEEVEGAARALLLLANVHSPELASGARGPQALFDACLGLSPHVRVFTLERPPGLGQLDELVDLVLDAG